MHPARPSMELFGRGHALARIRALVDDVRKGRSGSLILHGEPGVGKSALLSAARHVGSGLLLLEVTGTPAEARLPYAGLSRLLLPLAPVAEGPPGSPRAALRAALALGPADTDDPLAVYTGVHALLCEVAENRPLLVLVDDVQWMDDQSLAALAFCARRLSGEGVGMMLASRADPSGGVLAGLPALEVSAVDDEAAMSILTGAPLGGELAPSVARDLVRFAAGNPLALRELPALLTTAQREGSQPLDEPVHPGDQVVRAFREQLDALDPGARAAVLIVACSTDDDLATIVPALAHIGCGTRDLEVAEDGGVLTIGVESVGFRHPLVRGVAVRLAGGRERRRAHAALAMAVDPVHDPGRRVWHQAESVIGPDEAVAASLTRVADDDVTRSEYSRAAATYLRAARLSTTVDSRSRRLMAAADSAFAAGRTGWAADLAREVRTLRASEPLRTRADLLVGQAMVVAGDLREVSAFLVGVEPESGDLAARTRMLALASFAELMRDSTGTALGLARRSLGVAMQAATPEARVEAWSALAVSSVLTGHARVLRDAMPKILADIEAIPPGHPTLMTPIGVIGLGLSWVEEWEAARRCIHRAVTTLRGAGHDGALAVPLQHASQIAYRSGDWIAAGAMADEAAALGDDSGQVVATAFALAGRAILNASLGRENECRVDAVRARNLAWGTGASAVDVHVVYALGLLELGLGRPASARDHIAPLAMRDDGYGIGEPVVVPWRADLIEALVRLGETAEATRHLRVLADEGTRSGAPTARALVSRCRGMLAPAGAHEPHFRAALAAHSQRAMPFEAARTALLFGERLRRERRRAESRVHLQAALATFNRLGASAWAARAHEELDASGMRARRGAPGVDRLTPRERQVALTVAEGATNREAAARLFLSEKTVERHLGSVYRKLGLRSRSQLARWFASEDRAVEAPE